MNWSASIGQKISRVLWLAMMLASVGMAPAAEKKFDFAFAATNQPPPGCSNIVAGEGKPGDWRVILDEVPLDPSPFMTNALRTAKKSVVAQLARDTTDEHFPILILDNEDYKDFKFTTRFKMVDGQTEQMAGIAFRIQDERNYYYVRSSAIGDTFYFYTIKDGKRTPAIGNNMKFERGVWHELSVQCEGTRVQVMVDGKEAMPAFTDPTYASGKIGLWTKSDSVSYFTDMRITYTPKEPFAQRLVSDTLKEYPRLLGLKVFTAPAGSAETRLIAGNDAAEIGQPGETSDADVIKRGVNYYQKKKDVIVMTMPLCDRNGEPIAAVRILLKPVLGQTEQNALIRALPIIKTMQARIAVVQGLTD